MANNPFVPKALITQSDDPTKVLITDDSNYGNNDDGIVAGDVTARSVIIKDSAGNVLQTIPMTLQDDNSYAALQTISADGYFEYDLSYTVTSFGVKTGTVNYTTIAYYDQYFLTIMVANMGDCNCGKNICSPLGWARHLKEAAQLAGLKGQGVNSQNMITAANSFLLDILNT